MESNISSSIRGWVLDTASCQEDPGSTSPLTCVLISSILFFSGIFTMHLNISVFKRNKPSLDLHVFFQPLPYLSPLHSSVRVAFSTLSIPFILQLPTICLSSSPGHWHCCPLPFPFRFFFPFHLRLLNIFGLSFKSSCSSELHLLLHLLSFHIWIFFSMGRASATVCKLMTPKSRSLVHISVLRFRSSRIAAQYTPPIVLYSPRIL